MDGLDSQVKPVVKHTPRRPFISREKCADEAVKCLKHHESIPHELPRKHGGWSPAEKHRNRMEFTTPTSKNVSSRFDSSDYFDSNDKFQAYAFAEDVVDEFEFAYDRDASTLYVHAGPCWNPNAEFDVECICREVFKSNIRQNNIKEVTQSLKTLVTQPHDEIFDLPPHKLVVSNGTIDLRTGEFTPEWGTPGTLTWLDVEYDEDAYPIRFQSFLHDILHKDDIDIMWKVIGFCLYRGYPFQKAFMLLGDGANGKSTLLNALAQFLGEENVSSVGLHDITSNRFAASGLRGKLANISPDVGGTGLTGTDVFKQLTGEDQITADRKYMSPVSFTNTATLLFPANRMPDAPDEGDAYRRRWVYFEFPNSFKGDDAVPQKQLLDSFEQEHPGILAEAVRGIQRLWERGEFEETAFMREHGEHAHTHAKDPTERFIDQYLTPDANGSVRASKAFTAYERWCDEMGEEPVSWKTFYRRVETRSHVGEGKDELDRTKKAWSGVSLLYSPGDPSDPSAFM